MWKEYFGKSPHLFEEELVYSPAHGPEEPREESEIEYQQFANLSVGPPLKKEMALLWKE